MTENARQDDSPERLSRCGGDPVEALRALQAGQTSWLTDYEGLGFDAAKRRAEAEGWCHRVIGPDTVVTLDFRSDRLNLIVDADGNVTEISAG
jgi:hypothetical protein